MFNPTFDSTPRPGLLFIPDISGFTKFVTQTETTHAQHIISELLDELIEANVLNLTVSEIEGDAILFYRFGEAPTAEELLMQTSKMFVAFHALLKKYELNRICHCGACRTAHNLTLKFVTHYGAFSLNQIRDRETLFGKEVIVAHRLLKNDVDHNEYVLITDDLTAACHTYHDLERLAWGPIHTGEQRDDSGHTEYRHFTLRPLRKEIPAPQPKDYSLPGIKVHMGSLESIIEAPMDMVFNILIDLPFRNQWQEGLDPNWEIDHLNSAITQNGATHRCFNNGPVIVSHNFEQKEDFIRYTDSIPKDHITTIVTLKRLEGEKTLMSIDIFMKKHWLKQQIFHLFFKKKMTRALQQSFHNLNAYCQQLRAEDRDHTYGVILPAAAKSRQKDIPAIDTSR